MADTMRAIVISKFGGPEVFEYRDDVPKPVPGPDEVLIRVYAFGLNHAEMHMRKGEWDEWNPITGLECVGLVVESSSSSSSSSSSPAVPQSSSSSLPPGTRVAAVMGGLGRTRPGSYGCFVSVARSNVIAFPETTTLSWPQLAALPETYCTAWSCLFTVLDVKGGERVLIRGATSTLGQAALNLAVDAGAVVTATTRRTDKFEALLKRMGAVDVAKETGRGGEEEGGLDFSGSRSRDNTHDNNNNRGFGTDGTESNPKFDKTLNLIGNSALLESISLTRPGGRMLQAGWLGGLSPIKDFNPMVQMASGVHFSLFHSKVLGTRDFPLEDVPLADIVRKIEAGKWDAEPKLVYEYGDIVNAHRALDSHDVGGKIVVRH